MIEECKTNREHRVNWPRSATHHRRYKTLFWFQRPAVCRHSELGYTACNIPALITSSLSNDFSMSQRWYTDKGEGISILKLTSVGPELIPVSRQSAHRWHSHEPSGRLPLPSARPVVTFPATEHHRPLAGTKLYRLMTEAHVCEQLAESSYPAVERPGIKLATFRSLVQHPYHYTTEKLITWEKKRNGVS